MNKTFQELTCRPPQRPVPLVVAGAEEPKLLKAAAQAAREGWVVPVLVGREERIRALAAQTAPELEHCAVLAADGPRDTAEKACRAVEPGGMLMKGLLETKDLLRAILRQRDTMLERELISHISLLQVPYRRGIFGLSDTSVLVSPTLEQKAEIIRQGGALLAALGCPCPKVAVLAAVEHEDPAMPETVDGARLAEMGARGELGCCQVDGPVSLDIALDPEAARVKHYGGHVQGDADLMLAPDLAAGNLLGKCFNYTPESLFAGFLLGTVCPVALTSRASSLENKLLSIRVGAVLAGGMDR